MDAQAERKKLVAKQQNELKAMEKDVKKKKVSTTKKEIYIKWV